MKLVFTLIIASLAVPCLAKPQKTTPQKPQTPLSLHAEPQQTKPAGESLLDSPEIQEVAQKSTADANTVCSSAQNTKGEMTDSCTKTVWSNEKKK